MCVCVCVCVCTRVHLDGELWHFLHYSPFLGLHDLVLGNGCHGAAGSDIVEHVILRGGEEGEGRRGKGKES